MYHEILKRLPHVYPVLGGFYPTYFLHAMGRTEAEHFLDSHTQKGHQAQHCMSYILNSSKVFKKKILPTPKGTYLYCIKSPKRQGSSKLAVVVLID